MNRRNFLTFALIAATPLLAQTAPKKPPAMVENLVWTITDGGSGNGAMTLAWEDHSASVAIMVH